MESRFYLKATDRQAQALFDDAIATVKLIEFMGDKELYPEMNMNSPVVHKWKVLLRHKEEVGELKGTFSYNGLMKRLRG